MSRMSDMAQTIEDLRSAAAAISDAADWLTKTFSRRTARQRTLLFLLPNRN